MRRHDFRKQIGTTGSCATIIFDVHFEEAYANALNVSYPSSNRWDLAIRMGVSVFYDYFERLRTGKLTINIIDVEWLSVDTDHLCVMYACVSGLAEALDISIDHLGFGENNKAVFTFPERRTVRLPNV